MQKSILLNIVFLFAIRCEPFMRNESGHSGTTNSGWIRLHASFSEKAKTINTNLVPETVHSIYSLKFVSNHHYHHHIIKYFTN